MLSTDFALGAPNWVDLGTPDVEAAAAFYRAVFGWEFEPAGPQAGGYGFFVLDGRTVAAAGPPTEEGATSAWTLYFGTSDADAAAKAVETAAGTVRVPPTDVFDAGRLAHFTDPTGADFAVWQPRATRGLDTVAAPGALCWTELYTTDATAARDFYRTVFAWTFRDVPMGPGLSYATFSPVGDGPHGEQGGIFQLLQDNLDAGSASEWHPYFAVTDCDTAFATATGHGATTLIPPMDAPGVGRLAMLTDPAGAVFALLTPAPGPTA
ncbi:VOC family protein [Kitasatospora sp. NPDC059722]|uniref:VOC family protein n=1 Tax=Kitasatospora sp. NPDC059722 TaxID=3346925 RepID=UPI0036B7E411